MNENGTSTLPQPPYAPPPAQAPASGPPPVYGPPAVYGPPDQAPPPEQAPPFGQAPPPARPGRGARGVLAVVAAAAIAVSSGVVGAFAMHQIDGDRTTTVNHTSAPVLDRSSLSRVIAAVTPSVVSINTGTAEGSGVILTADGAILTNNHVVATARGNTVRVTFSSGKSAQATIVGTDPRSDLAVIKAQGVSGLSPAKFGDSDDLQQGDTVIALGSPLGLEGSASEGIVSALHRTITVGDNEAPSQRATGANSISDAVQTDAAINPGNSGGPLVNLAGEVVGINTAIATNGQGQGNIGVGFAIPSNRAKEVAGQLLAGQKVSHPFLGVQVGDADNGSGAVIADVVAGGPAAKAGLAEGDVVTKVGDKTVGDARDLIAAIQAAKPGDKLVLTVNRNGNQMQVTVTLGEAS
jgi:putative serine protease PepD